MVEGVGIVMAHGSGKKEDIDAPNSVQVLFVPNWQIRQGRARRSVVGSVPDAYVLWPPPVLQYAKRTKAAGGWPHGFVSLIRIVTCRRCS